MASSATSAKPWTAADQCSFRARVPAARLSASRRRPSMASEAQADPLVELEPPELCPQGAGRDMEAKPQPGRLPEAGPLHDAVGDGVVNGLVDDGAEHPSGQGHRFAEAIQ